MFSQLTNYATHLTKTKRLLYYLPAAIVLIFLFVAPLFIETAITSLISKILIFGLMAMGLDIAYGFTGLWSFGHAAIAGVAAYTTGILIKSAGISSFWIVAPAGVAAAIGFTAIFGLISLRTSGIYFLLVTFALGQLVYSIAYKWRSITYGSDGLGGIPYPDIGINLTTGNFYYMLLIIFVICAFLLYWLINSPFGYSLRGIRESERRMRVLGYNTWLHKYFALLISGLFVGIGGVLYIYYNGLIAPDNIGMEASGLLMIMVIIGGSGTLWGAFVGSAIIYLLQYYVSIISAQRWPIVLGICFIAAVLLARNGIFPMLNKIWGKLINHVTIRS